MARRNTEQTAAGDSNANKNPQSDAQLVKAEKVSPVQDAISKRLRAARKKLGRIKIIEDLNGKEKELNLDQVLAVLFAYALPLCQGVCSDRTSHCVHARSASWRPEQTLLQPCMKKSRTWPELFCCRMPAP